MIKHCQAFFGEKLFVIKICKLKDPNNLDWSKMQHFNKET